MAQNVRKLEQFYKTPLGQAAQIMVLRRLHALWPHLEGMDVLSYGYGLPYLRDYQLRTHSLIHAMPESQGVVQNLQRRGNTSLLVSDPQLPFYSTVFDRVFVAHGLEEAANMPALLKELWRVMKPEGRIVIVAANRAGLWARSDKTPFGAGRPFSRFQLSSALKTAGFIPAVRAGALYCPPVKKLCGPRTRSMFETFGETVWPGFCGIVLVEAVKRLYVRPNASAQKRVYRPNISGAIGTSGKIYQPKEKL